jgi:hypothetical protein
MANTKVPVELSSTPSIVDNGNATAITIDSSENVGIGTSPNANLHIGDASATGDATNPALQIGGASTYRLGMYTSTEGAVIENKNGDDGLQFRVKTAGEAMRIDGGTGYVGIQTSSPSEALTVAGHVDLINTAINLNFMETGVTDSNHRIRQNAGNLYFQKLSDDKGTATDRIVLDGGTGYVGIGTSSPAKELDVAGTIKATGADNANTMEVFGGTTTNQSFGLLVDAGTSAVDYAARFRKSDNTIIMEVSGDGNVGIGTSSPSTGLHVVTAGGTTPFRVQGGANAGVNIMEVGYAGGGAGANFIIDDNGSCGIGTSSPTAKLDVNLTGAGDAVKITGNSITDFDFVGNPPEFNLEDTGSTSGAKRARITLDASLLKIQGLSDDDSSLTHNLIIGDLSNGNIGIGTTAPDHDLHIETTNPTLILAQSGSLNNANSGRILFAESPSYTTNNSHFEIKYDGAENHLYFGSPIDGSTDLFVVGRDGNAGIGTSNPLNTAHIYGTGQTTANLADSGNQGGMLRITDANTAAGAGGAILFANYHADDEPSMGFAAIKGLLNNGSTRTQGSLAFSTRNAINSSALTERMRIWYNGNIGIKTTSLPNATLQVNGSLSKSSGSFTIDHPLESKKDTHNLVHSFVEAPQADNIYRGVVSLVDGSATINLDTEAGMTEGTFILLNTNTSCFTSNESDWDAVKGSVSGNILTISCQNTTSTATVSWLVIGERHDQHMIDTEWTDENGKVIVEPLKIVEPLEEETIIEE